MAEVTEFNVSNLFNKQTSNGKLAFVTKGAMNNVLMRPQILNAHTPYATTAQSIVTATNIVGQIFKAEKDNINGLTLSLLGQDGSTSITVDDFQSYASSSALQAVWVMTDGDDEALRNTTYYSPNNSSTQSMELQIKSDSEWTKTITSVDLTAATFNLDYRQNTSFSNGKISLFIGDGTNTKSIQLAVDSANTWQTFDLMESAMSEDDTGTTDITAITEIGFRVDDQSYYDEAWVDNFTYTITNSSKNAVLKLWDMGSTIPISGTTSLDDGTQYTTLGDHGINGSLVSEIDISLTCIKRFYQVNEFMAGTAKEREDNSLLTIGNYYAITLEHVDCDYVVYGTDPSLEKNFYTDGFAFTTPDESTEITAIGQYNDLKFNIFSTQDVYIIGTQIKMFKEDGESACAGANARYCEAVVNVDNEITDYITTMIQAYNNGDRDLTHRPIFIEDGGKIGTYYQDDEDDDVYKLIFNIIYFYEN